MKVIRGFGQIRVLRLAAKPPDKHAMEFAYEATDAEGTLIEGSIDAPDANKAMQQIRKAGYVPLRLVQPDDESPLAPEPSAGPPAKPPAKPPAEPPTEPAFEPAEEPAETQAKPGESWGSQKVDSTDTADKGHSPERANEFHWVAENDLPDTRPPDPAPRRVNSVGGWYRFTDPLAAFGLRFGAIGLVVSVILLFYRSWAALFPFAFVAIGGAIGSVGFKSSTKRVRAWRLGTPVPATIVWIGQDTSYRINGRSPWMMRYEFFVDGDTVVGTRKSFNPQITDLVRGEKIWAVYLPENHSISAEWPPIL